jgi:hypothetical protein
LVVLVVAVDVVVVVVVVVGFSGLVVVLRVVSFAAGSGRGDFIFECWELDKLGPIKQATIQLFLFFGLD